VERGGGDACPFWFRSIVVGKIAVEGEDIVLGVDGIRVALLRRSRAAARTKASRETSRRGEGAREWRVHGGDRSHIPEQGVDLVLQARPLGHCVLLSLAGCLGGGCRFTCVSLEEFGAFFFWTLIKIPYYLRRVSAPSYREEGTLALEWPPGQSFLRC
jgi:hypothetical protein